MGRDRSYWALSVPDRSEKRAELRSEVERIGYKPKASLTRNGLVALLQHHEAGHLCYDKCTDDELKTFAIDRGLLSKKSKPTRARLISLLLKADRDPSFRQFSDLPPELRSHVYDFYIADITTEPLKNPEDPPLTRASRLLRSESLASFYKACTFRISMTGRWQQSLTVTGSTKCFLHKLSDLKLQSMRNLHIAVSATLCLFDAYHEDLKTTLMRASIKFSPGMTAYSINCVVASHRPFELKNSAAAIEGRLREVFDDMVDRQGPQKLKASDLINLNSRELKVFWGVSKAAWR